jgi:hypothetical protein
VIAKTITATPNGTSSSMQNSASDRATTWLPPSTTWSTAIARPSRLGHRRSAVRQPDDFVAATRSPAA